MKLLKTFILTTATTLMAQAIIPLEIVEKSDNIRNPALSHVVRVIDELEELIIKK